MLNKNHGNVLFIILIGIALFGALSYAVMSSSGSGGSAERELSMLKATRMAQYGASLRTTIRRMTMMGTDVHDIVLHGGELYEPCTSGSTCVFAAEGGGASVMDLGADSNIDKDGNYWYYYQPDDGIAIQDVGTAAPDMLITRHFQYNSAGMQLCRAINNSLGIDGIPGGAGTDWFEAAPGQRNACVADGTEQYIFYLVFYPL